MGAKYFAYTKSGQKRYDRDLHSLRMHVYSWLIAQIGNMEMRVSLFVDRAPPRVVGVCYLKWLNGRAYLIYHNASNLQTYRSYYDIETTIERYIADGIAPDWIEIISLRGRQICMTGGAEDVYYRGV